MRDNKSKKTKDEGDQKDQKKPSESESRYKDWIIVSNQGEISTTAPDTTTTLGEQNNKSKTSMMAESELFPAFPTYGAHATIWVMDGGETIDHFMRKHRTTRKARYICGGTYYKGIIITAAHCLDEYIKGDKFSNRGFVLLKAFRRANKTETIETNLFGHLNNDYDNDQEVFVDVEKAILHPDYDEYDSSVPGSKVVNDIAILKLGRVIKPTKDMHAVYETMGRYNNSLGPRITDVADRLKIEKIFLATRFRSFLKDVDYESKCWIPIRDLDPTERYRMILNLYPEKFLDTFSDVALPLVDDRTCERLLMQNTCSSRIPIGNGDFCAGGEKDRDACKGNGGTGLYCKFSILGVSTWVLKGVTSWGLGCGELNVPGVYADVSQYASWIEDNTAN